MFPIICFVITVGGFYFPNEIAIHNVISAMIILTEAKKMPANHLNAFWEHQKPLLFRALQRS